jgi:hypothetical protein
MLTPHLNCMTNPATKPEARPHSEAKRGGIPYRRHLMFVITTAKLPQDNE